MRSGCFIHILIIYYFFSVVQYPAEIDKKNFRETVSPHFALKGTIRLNKRNSNIPSRERKDSVTETERRGMQQGFPVRKDADRSINPPINRPDGPREVPLSLRQGKIPVREDAATGRTFPVLNRFGKKPDAVPVTEEPVAETEIEPVTDESAMETEPEAVVDEPAVEAEPEAVVDVPATEAEPEAVVDSPAVEAEPEAVVDEPAVEAEPEATVEEPVVEAEPEPVVDEPVVEDEPEPVVDEPVVEDEPEPVVDEPISEAEPEPVVDEPISEAEPEPVTEEPAVEAEPEPVDDDPLEPPVFIQKKRTAYVQALDEPVQTEDPLEATRVFDKVPPAVVPAVPEEPMSADTGSDTTGNGSKKLWILPLLIAILAAVGLCIGIPAMVSREGNPDFDMSADYESTPEGQETGGTAVETQPDDQPAKFSVTLTLPGQSPITVSTAEITLADLLDQIGYTIQDSDWFPVDPGTLLTEDTSITVETIVYTTETETITLPYETIVTELQTIPRGQKDVFQKGQTGTKVITYAIESVGGREISRTVSSEKITKQPVNESYQLGVGGTLVGNDGKTYSYSYYRVVNATYYDLKGATYLGYDADESVVAVDKNCIPLGTKIYVKNDQFDFGVRTAADTGSFKGWEVDIWLDDSNPQKAAFAQIGYVKDMVIYYLD